MRAVSTVAAAMAILAAVASALSYKPEQRLNPFANAIPLQNYSVLSGATVSIEEGYQPGDLLQLDYQGEFPIKSNFDARTGTLFISGSATVSEYARAVQDVVFVTTSTLGGPRRVTWSFGANTLFLTRTQHWYKFIPDIGSAWSKGLDTCAGMTWMGMQGYLATVTSAVEMDGLSRKAWISAWLGGMANNAQSWNWTWQAGPEQGWPFWNGPNMYKGGSAPMWTSTAAYTSWGRFQPSDDAAEVFLALVPSAYDAYSSWYSQQTKDGVQGYICEFGGLDSEVVAWQAMNSAGTVVLDFGCDLYTDIQSCTNQAELGCTWSNSVCLKPACNRRTDQLSCAGSASCEWSTSGSIGMCVATSCSKIDKVTCPSAAGCMWSAATSTCVMATCGGVKGSCSCAQAGSACKWENTQCFNRAGYNCNGMDVVYMIDGSLNARGTFGLYPNGYVGLFSRFRAADQYLTNTMADEGAGTSTPGQRVAFVSYAGSGFVATGTTGIGSAGKLTGNRDQKIADIADLERRTTTDSSRVLSTAAAAANTIFQNAVTSSARPKIAVVFATGPIADAATARSSLVSTGIKFFGVALGATPTATAASSTAYRDLVTALPAGSVILNLTVDQVTDQAIFGLCNPAAPFGAAANIVPLQTCGTMDKPTCENSKTCAWSYSVNACQASQCLAKCSNTCGLDATCAWNNQTMQCEEKCAGSSAGCPASCVSANGLCRPQTCNGNPTEDACIADPAQCSYNASANTKCKPISCPSYTSQATCNADPGCSYENLVCVPNPCKSRVVGNCEQLPQCSWGPATAFAVVSTCNMRDCVAIPTEDKCVATANCAWNVTASPSVCVPAVCSGYMFNPSTAMSKCGADSRCRWISGSAGEGRCAVKSCDMHQRACDCSADDACVWRNNTCKDARYAQCPAIDLFFLVEATPAMQQDFGRHPNGFVGTVEAIRSWARAAPFAASAAATGFRMGMALYGAPSAQLVPPASGSQGTQIGNGTNFVTTGSDFYGASGALSYFEGELATYAAGAQGQNQLRPGLEAALNMFQASSAPGRERVLVILGSSPFTDGTTPATAIGPVVEQLENISVSIFSNVIRRFNTLTPVEMMAENFIKPLASDPASTHFLYTTIENLRSGLLDQFCDPSTPAGRALSVSRDNTLPCNWLAQQECPLQRNCMWDPSATVQCPLPTQCPNLGCQELPASLASSGFTCAQCRSLSGIVTCSSTPFAAPKGMCVPNGCATGQCAETACNATSGCGWDQSMSRCNAVPCAGYSAPLTCDADLGCFWVQGATSGTCVQSAAWRKRSPSTCGNEQTIFLGRQIPAFLWKAAMVPAICVERRCPYLSDTQCQGTEGAALGCTYNGGLTPKCYQRECPYSTSLQCNADANCYWNPYDTLLGTCQRIPLDGSCVLSGMSNFSQCTATCGAAIQYQSRRVLSFPDTSKSAPMTCAAVATTLTPAAVVATKACTVPSNCSIHCSSYNTNNDRVGCARDISCRWTDSCVPLSFRSCAELTTATDCQAVSAACSWDSVTGFCVPTLSKCTSYSTQSQCMTAASAYCVWRTGNTANNMSLALGASVQLVNPGPQQKPVFVFPHLMVSSNQTIWGATIAIEKNYQRNKDVLALLYPSPITATWSPAAGTLTLSGAGTVGDYANAIRYVTFATTSAAPDARVVTWSLGNGTVYSGVTKRLFRYFAEPGLTWDMAAARCSASSMWGRQGYLAVLNTADDNAVVASKLWAQGWIGATDAANGRWQWSTGTYVNQPSDFWKGPAAVAGGTTVNKGYANWNAVLFQPAEFLVTGVNHATIGLSGTWEAQPNTWTGAQGYVCQYGGMPGDQPASTPVSGAAVIGAGGCMPQPCIWRNTSTCSLDSECSLNTRCITQNAAGACTNSVQECVPACGTQSTPVDCEKDTRCKWDTMVTPPSCTWNPCNLGKTSCEAHPNCTWDPELQCRPLTGCAALATDVSCGRATACVWSGSRCVKKQCTAITNPDVCLSIPLCQYNEQSGLCSDAVCQSTTESECTSSSKCQWVEPNLFYQGYSVGGNPIYPFSTSSPPGDLATESVDGITVMIVQGFKKNLDTLDVSDAYLNQYGWVKNYDAATGVLDIYMPAMTSAQQAYLLIKSQVTFTTTSKSTTPRQIVYTYGRMTVLAASGAVLKYVPSGNLPITFAQARTECASKVFFGQPGVLASLPSEADALNLAKLRPSAWLGAVESSSNTWTWLATGTRFWEIGLNMFGPINNANGTVFAYWAAGEPVEAKAGQQLWAAVTPTGTWQAASSLNAVYGYVCQFTAPQAVASASRYVRLDGCSPRACVSLTKAQCSTQAGCSWYVADGTCGLDDFCASGSVPSACNVRAGCYWDYTEAVCTTAAPDSCTGLAPDKCNNTALFPSCRWDGAKLLSPAAAERAGRSMGACVKIDCFGLSIALCQNRPQCYVSQNQCVSRTCGYVTRESCFADPECSWNNSICKPARCRTYSTVQQCNNDNTCVMNGAFCERVQCSAADAVSCQENPMCIYAKGACSIAGCSSNIGKEACNANPNCYYSEDSESGDACITRRCNTNFDNAATCTNPVMNGGAGCIWKNGACAMTPSRPAAPTIDACEKEIAPNLWWLWVELIIIGLLIVGMAYRLYLAYFKGMSFTEPARTNVKYSPHQNYKDLLGDEAEKTAEETNVLHQEAAAPGGGYQRPNINDL